MGRSCSIVMTTNLPSLSNMMIGVFASQNSLMNCLHMPQGLLGVLASVATAMARMSPGRQPLTKVSDDGVISHGSGLASCTAAVPSATLSAQVPTG